MNISEFLASMQPDPQSKALARATSMGIPDADNDPNTKDAASAQQLAMRTDDLPESDNIEDLRDGNYDDTVTPENMVNMRPDGAYREPGLGGMFATGGDEDVEEYAEGGEVEGDDEEVTAPVTQGQGAIPDEEGFEGAANDQQSIDEGGNLPGAQPEEGDWRNTAMEALTNGIKHGYDAIHAVNRPMSDDTHEPSARSMLSGEGATPHDQVEAAQDAVDPEQKMDEPTRLLKAIGAVSDFYKKRYGEGSEAPDDPASKAVWGIIQAARKAYDANAAGATVAADHGKYESAAKMAQAAFNKVPGVGAVTQVLWGQATPAAAAEQEAVPTPRPKPADPSGYQTQPSDVMAPQDQGKRLQARPSTETPGKFDVKVSDPERNVMLFQASLTPEQLKHALAEGFDKVLHRGVTTQLGMASKTTENHKSFGQRLAEANGLPAGMDVGGMSVGQIANLRDQYAHQRVKEGSRPDVEREKFGVQREIAGAHDASAERRVQMQQEGLNKRGFNAPGQMESTRRAVMKQAATDANKWVEQQQAQGKKVSQADVDAVTRTRIKFWQENSGSLRASSLEPGQQTASGAQTTNQQGQTTLPVGHTEMGFRYVGGPPGKASSWKPIGN